MGEGQAMILAAVAAMVAGATTFILARPVISWLERRSVLDVPVERSSHVRPTVRGGGLAPAVGMVAAALVAAPIAPRLVLTIVWVAAGFGALGAAEDLVGLATRWRLLGQFTVAVAALILMVSPIDDLAVHGRTVMLATLVVTVIWLVAYVNAFNFMDGINGISVAQATVAGASWVAIGVWESEPALVAAGAIAAVAALAFLPFNFPVAKVFLGDVGSYFFGGWLAATVVVGLEVGIPAVAMAAPLFLYLCDTGTTLLRRAVHGDPLFEPHRQHAYQQLVRGGWSHATTTTVVAATMVLSSLLGAVSLGGSVPARVIADSLLVLLMLTYLLGPRIQRHFRVTRAKAPITIEQGSRS